MQSGTKYTVLEDDMKNCSLINFLIHLYGKIYLPDTVCPVTKK